VHRLSDPEQFGIAVSGVSLTADFLAPQKVPTRVEQFQTPEWALDFHEAHVKARIYGPLPPGWVSLGLMRSPAASSWYGYAARPGMLVCNPPGVPIDGCITPGFACAAVNVPVAVWERCRALAGIERSAFGGFVAFHLPPPLYAYLERRLRATRHLLRTASTTPHLATFAAHEAADFATHIATTAWELSATATPSRDSLRNRTRLAHRAETWMRDHLAEPVRIPEVCLALRVSRRELEYAFRAAFDQSPRDHLQALRLNAIRRVLRDRRSDDPVIRAAFDHGITHLGRFAAEYRTLFGERPSET
jgi:AraC-like DNA-binding protein